MPAVTVEDITALPRIPDVGEAVQRPVRSLTTAPSGVEGEGFPVRRAFAGVDLADLDPFIHMDQMGEVEYAPGEPKGTPWHPHRGFETVTYIIDGTFEHQDSNGGGGVITNGDTQWMTAGAGILHIEKPPEELVMSGGLFHGSQLWVNLPKAQKWAPPRYQDLRANEVGLLASPDAGALVRVIAGDLAEHRGPGDTYTPITYAHATIAAGCAPGPAVEPGVQRARLRPGRRRHRRCRAPSDPDRSARRAGCGRRDAHRGVPDAGEPVALARGARARRSADRRAGRLVRAVRDEHPRRTRPGVRGLPGGQARDRSPRRTTPPTRSWRAGAPRRLGPRDRLAREQRPNREGDRTMDKVVHFEVPTDDLDRAKAFYGASFGWQLQTMSTPDMDYTSVITTSFDEKTGMPKEPGAINGGMTQRSDETPAPIITVGVDFDRRHAEADRGRGRQHRHAADPDPGDGRVRLLHRQRGQHPRSVGDRLTATQHPHIPGLGVLLRDDADPLFHDLSAEADRERGDLLLGARNAVDGASPAVVGDAVGVRTVVRERRDQARAVGRARHAGAAADHVL